MDVLDREVTFIQRIASLLLKSDQLETFASSASQRLSQLQEELHFVDVEEHALAANVDSQAAEIRKLKAGKYSFLNALSKQYRKNAPYRKRVKTVDIYSGLDLRYDGVVIKVLENLSASCGLKTLELCMFDALGKRGWLRLGENVLRN